MTVLSDYVSRMVEGGMDQGEAMQIAAELFAAGLASAAVRPSAGALRTRKWRHKTSQNVTCDAEKSEFESVTNRHKASQSVTCDNASILIDISKKESKRESRASQIADGWRPAEKHWLAAVKALGSEDRAERELKKFANHAIAKGAKYKNWNAAWDNWFQRALEWAPVKLVVPTATDAPSDLDWRSYLRTYKQFGRWQRGLGNEPGMPGCRAPHDLLKEFGYAETKAPAALRPVESA